MSVRASSWAWETSRSTGSAFLVLLALADHAGQDGGDCWPSVTRLAQRCRVDVRTVQRAVDRLVELGELVVMENAGPRGTNRYRLTFATAEELPLGDGPQPGDEPGDTAADPRQDATPGESPPPASTRRTPGTTPPEPKEEPKNPPTPTSGGADATHRGQHPSCRACGTNPRGTKPPDPASQAQAAARRKMEEAEARKAAAPPPVDAAAGRRLAAETKARLRGETP